MHADLRGGEGIEIEEPAVEVEQSGTKNTLHWEDEGRMNAGKSGFHYGLVVVGMVICLAALCLNFVQAGFGFLAYANMVWFGWCCWELGGLKLRGRRRNDVSGPLRRRG